MIRVKSESLWETLDLDQIALSSGDDDSVRASSRRGASQQLKKGPWTPSEDAILEAYVKKHGVRNWNVVQKDTGLLRCGKSCRLRWTNQLRPDLKKGTFTKEEEKLIIKLHRDMGNKWARIAAYLPGRTDNEIKNYWNTRIKKCWRTVTPIYPANICPRASNEYQHESTEFSFSEKLANDVLHGNGRCVPDFTWDNFIDDREGLSYAPHLPDVSISNLLGQNYASKNYGFMDQVNQEKVLKESEISLRVVNATIDGTLLGSHAFSNGSFSASRPTTGPSKMELPSFQYCAESDPNDWSTYSRTSVIQLANFADLRMHSSAAILSAKFESMRMSPRNSGQSEEVLPEAHALSSVENQQLSVGSLSSSIGTSCDAMMGSSELGLWEQDPNFCTLISGCLSAPPLCPTSPGELQKSETSCANSPVFGSSEPAAPQYVQGEVSPHREDSRLDALFSWNTMNTLK